MEIEHFSTLRGAMGQLAEFARAMALAGAAATGPALAAAAAGAAAPVAAAVLDPHPKWSAVIERMLVEAGAVSDDVDPAAPIFDRVWPLEDKIAATPTPTPAGIAEQITLVIRTHEAGGPSRKATSQGLPNAVLTLEQMAGRA
jgi:hypothetical protein